MVPVACIATVFFTTSVGEDTDGRESKWMECPKCGAELKRLKGARHVYQLHREGLQFIGDFPRTRENKKWVN